MRGRGEYLPHFIYVNNLHHLVAQMVDDLDGNTAGRGLFKRPGGVAVKAGPGILIDLCVEGLFERFVRIVGAEKIGVTDKETFFVIVGVDKPAGDPAISLDSTLPRLGWKTSTPLIFTAN